MNILVTGANGQLGCELRAAAPSVPEHHFIFTTRQELDVTDAAAVSCFFQERRVHVAINCASYTQVDKAESAEKEADRVNRCAAAYLGEAAARVGALLIHISTDYVFGGVRNLPFTEQDMPEPLGVYGRTKLEGERAIRSSGCRYIILRTSWLYSVYGENFVKTMCRLMRERKELSVIYDQVGCPTHAKDLAAAILVILRSPRLEESLGTYHFTNEGVCSWYDFALAIRHFAGLDSVCRVRPCRSWEFPTKALRPAYSVLDKTAIKKAFGIEIEHWMDALRECFSAMNLR